MAETGYAGNHSEALVAQVLRQQLPSEAVVYTLPFIGSYEADLVVIWPEHAVFVIEVKGYCISQVIRAERNSVTYKVGSEERVDNSPLSQARRYAWELRDKLRERFNPPPAVLPVVCFPNISTQELAKSGLRLASPPKASICRDQMAEFGQRLRAMAARHERSRRVTPLDADVALAVRSEFEDISEPSAAPAEASDVHRPDVRGPYSKLIVLPTDLRGCDVVAILDSTLDLWQNGTKVFLFVNDPSLLDHCRRRVEERIAARGIGHLPEFRIDQKSEWLRTFRLEAYYVREALPPWSLVDGQSVDSVGDASIDAFIRKLDDVTAFNGEQYRLEHAPIDRDIIVKAGAGTGKTRSMVSRLSYVIYAMTLSGLSPAEVSTRVVMVTFTNEAANEMKRRLVNEMRSVFALTGDRHNLELADAVLGMQISTIHKWAESLISQHAVRLGLSHGIRVTNEIHRWQEIWSEELENYLSSIPGALKDLPIPAFQLRKLAESLVRFLANHGIDATASGIDFGTCPDFPILTDILRHCTLRTETRFRETLHTENTVRLQDLMVVLDAVLRDMDAKPDGKPRFLFVDEFQDTDDLQIKLLCQLRALFGFRILAVGDVKQCIYRFRGARSTAFDRLKEQLGNPLVYRLSTNYRSTIPVIRCVNAMVDKLVEDSLLTKDDSLEASPSATTDGGWRSVLVHGGTITNRLTVEVERLYKEMPEGETLAILVRENWQVKAVKVALNGRLFVETDSGGQFYSLPSTIDFYRLVNALAHPRSAPHLMQLFLSPYATGKMDIATVTSLPADSAEQVAALSSCLLGGKWAEYVRRLRIRPALQVLREIVLAFEPWMQPGVTPDHADSFELASMSYRANLNLLFERLSSRGGADGLSLGAIEETLRWPILTGQEAECRELSEAAARGKKRVKCLTVHKSKGLEFDTVVIPYADMDMAAERGGSHPRFIVDQSTGSIRVGYSFHSTDANDGKAHLKNDIYDEMSADERRERLCEEARLLYVAATRAKRVLCYFRPTTSAESPRWCYYLTRGHMNSCVS